jgi:NTP pyrophosphatase (non-canonical NTP hydrolase)
MLDIFYATCHGLNRRYPDGNDPFRIMTCLLEEAGELAQQVNHFEDTGIKRQKYGEPDRAHMAKELMDVISAALRVAIYYHLEEELAAMAEQRYQRMTAEGLIDPLRDGV